MWYRIYDLFEEYIAYAFFSIIFFLMVFGVVTRYFFDTSYPWNIELCRYSFVWLTFAGAAYLRKENAHIRIEFIINFLNRKLPPWARKGIWLLKETLTIGFLIVLVYYGFILANKTWRFRSQAMQVPQFYLYISTSVGGLLYLIREVPAAIHDFKAKISEKQEVADNTTRGEETI
jgi:TRAP-type C4-dicarboxylate transport system permease small subunit